MRRAVFIAVLLAAGTAAAQTTLSIAKSGPASMRAGDTVTYAIAVMNAGAATASNVRMADAQPNNLALVSVAQTSGPPFDCIVSETNSAVCTIETLDPGVGAGFELVYRVDPGAPAGTQITNRAEVSAGSSDDPDYAYGSATATAMVVSGTPQQSPQIAFHGSPAVVPVGGGATLSWSVTDATSVTIDHGVGAQPLSGSAVVILYATTTFTLTATGPGGTSSAYATVSIAQAPAITFTAAPQTIAPGETSRLEWTVSDADDVAIDNGIGAQPASGVKDVQPNVTTTYTLTARGPGGVSTGHVTVFIEGTLRHRAARH